MKVYSGKLVESPVASHPVRAGKARSVELAIGLFLCVGLLCPVTGLAGPAALTMAQAQLPIMACEAVVEAAELKTDPTQTALQQLDQILEKIEAGELRTIADIELVQFANGRISENQNQISRYLRSLNEYSNDFGGQRTTDASNAAAKIAVLLERLEKSVTGEKSFLEKLYQILPSLRARKIKKIEAEIRTAHGQAIDSLSELKASQDRLKLLLPELDRNLNLLAEDETFLLEMVRKIHTRKSNLANDKELETRLEITLAKVNEALLGLQLLAETAEVYRSQIDNAVVESFNQDSQLKAMINNHLTLSARKLVGKTTQPLNFEPYPKKESPAQVTAPAQQNSAPANHPISVSSAAQSSVELAGNRELQLEIVATAAHGDFNTAHNSLGLLEAASGLSQPALLALVDLLSYSHSGHSGSDNQSVIGRAAKILKNNARFLDAQVYSALAKKALSSNYASAWNCLEVLGTASAIDRETQKNLVKLLEYSHSHISLTDANVIRGQAANILKKPLAVEAPPAADTKLTPEEEKREKDQLHFVAVVRAKRGNVYDVLRYLKNQEISSKAVLWELIHQLNHTTPGNAYPDPHSQKNRLTAEALKENANMMDSEMFAALIKEAKAANSAGLEYILEVIEGARIIDKATEAYLASLSEYRGTDDPDKMNEIRRIASRILKNKPVVEEDSVDRARERTQLVMLDTLHRTGSREAQELLKKWANEKQEITSKKAFFELAFLLEKARHHESMAIDAAVVLMANAHKFDSEVLKALRLSESADSMAVNLAVHVFQNVTALDHASDMWLRALFRLMDNLKDFERLEKTRAIARKVLANKQVVEVVLPSQPQPQLQSRTQQAQAQEHKDEAR